MSQLSVEYLKQYSEHKLWTKLARYARLVGWGLVERALCLFYAAQRPETPAWAKGIIYSALGYFILPFDSVPDVTPVAGYADDLGVLTVALATVAAYVTPEVRRQARDKLTEWFGDSIE
jgi:uncharacterized membrane protein YkvA (DUF1232 family)